MKKKDIIIIAVLVAMIGIGYYIYTKVSAPVDGDIIDVYYHGEVIDSLDIRKAGKYSYTGDYGRFTLEITDDERYHAINVECPNHDCEKVGWVSKNSKMAITCLPNDIWVIQRQSEVE